MDAEWPVPELGDGPHAPFMVDDMQALTCVLEALRDGTPGAPRRADAPTPSSAPHPVARGAGD